MLELHNVVGGAPVDPGGARLEVLDPSTGEVVATAPDSDADAVGAACRAAAEAFSSWSRRTPAERSGLLLEAADLLEAHGAELSALEVLDTGKPAAQMADDELPAIVDQVRFFAGAARLLEGRAAGEYLDGVTSMVRREPVGLCGQVTPWNYPLMMAVWKWAPALAAGNTVVLKPSELTPLSTVAMAELLAGLLPPGVLNVVCGGVATGRALVANPAVAMISLTGSVRAGREVAAAAAGRLARVHLELGGNAPVLVFADGGIELAVEAVAAAGYYNAGQDCTAAARVLVERDCYEEFSERLAAVAAATTVGAPSEGAAVGPMISAAQRERAAGLLARLGSHATVLCGGRAVDRAGFFFEPTVVAGVRQEDEIVQEELFAPVVTVQPFAGEEEAVASANGVAQGLCASVFTSDLSRAVRLARELDFGQVSVNAHAPMTSEMPHGGFKGSGYGKDLSVYGLEEYTRLKHVGFAC